MAKNGQLQSSNLANPGKERALARTLWMGYHCISGHCDEEINLNTPVRNQIPIIWPTTSHFTE
jgi:hypothetical protein